MCSFLSVYVSYLEKRFNQFEIRALYGDAMLVSLGGTRIWCKVTKQLLLSFAIKSISITRGIVHSRGSPRGVLVPLFPSKIALCICSHVPTLSQNVFVLSFFEFCSPVPKNWLVFPCSLRYFANVPLFSKTPGRPSL